RVVTRRLSPAKARQVRSAASAASEGGATKSSTSQPMISSSAHPKRRSKAGLQSWTLLLESSTTLASGLFSTMAVRKALRSLIVSAIRSRASGWLSARLSVFIAGAVIRGESFPPFRDADLPFLRLVRAESTLIGIEFFAHSRGGAGLRAQARPSIARTSAKSYLQSMVFRSPHPINYLACTAGEHQ